jgi:antitoxin Phd
MSLLRPGQDHPDVPNLDSLAFATVSTMIWQLQTAKQKLSEVVDRALAEGPQTITRHGRETAVVVSVRDYRRLTEDDGFKSYLLSGPTLEGLDLERGHDLPRPVELDG